MALKFASRCKFQNAKQHKAHRKRVLGITMISNSSVSEQMKLKGSRHSNLKSHAGYQRINDESIEKKYETMNPSLLDDSSKHARDTNQLHPSTPSPQAKQTNYTTPSYDSSTIPPQPNKQNIINPSFDPHHSPLPLNQVVINIGNSNYCHLSPYFAQSDVNPINTSPPQVRHSSGEKINCKVNQI